MPLEEADCLSMGLNTESKPNPDGPPACHQPQWVESPILLPRFLFFLLAIPALLFNPFLLEPVFAQPDLNSFAPRAATIGQTTEITASGKFDQWPVQFHSNRPGLKFEALKKGIFRVTVPPEAAPGIYLVRFLDRKGASQPVPLVTDSIASLVEKEPNDSPKAPQEVPIPANVSGVLAKSGDVDCFRVQCKKGESLVATVMGNPLFGQTMDSVVQICDERGFVLNQNDDRRGIDPMLVVPIPADGHYLVRIFAFPSTPNSTVRFAGAADYRYLLQISSGPVLWFPSPLSTGTVGKNQAVGFNLPTDTEKGPQLKQVVLPDQQILFYQPGTAGFFELPPSGEGVQRTFEGEHPSEKPLSIPFDFTGTISRAGELDLLRFEAKKGEKIRFQLDARKYGLELDPLLTLFDSEGKSLLNKDDNSKADPDLVVDFTVPADGLYYARIKDSADAGGPHFVYRIRSSRPTPDFSLSVTANQFAAVPGKPLEIEVAVERKDGFNQPVEIRAEGLGEAAKQTAVISAAKGETAKKIKLKIEPVKEFQQTFRIIGKSDNQQRTARQVLPCGRNVETLILTATPAPKK
ncbi:MAG: PPC domain-containing protein [Planctomycetota bacterium]|nr:PPC domain-containing protein [Planctomycetota bacterium]